MFRRWLFTLILLTSANPAQAGGSPHKPQKEVPSRLEQVAQRVQAFYEKHRNFSAQFTQTYTYVTLGRSTVSKGQVAFEKPGKMRWDYAPPESSRYVLDGKTLWMYQPQDKQVVKNDGVTEARLGAAVTFLWGRGKLLDEFSVAEGASTLPSGQVELALTPLQSNPNYQSLKLVVVEASGEVLTSTVVDPLGNTNSITFSQVKFDAKLPQDFFIFVPPAGVEIMDLNKVGH